MSGGGILLHTGVHSFDLVRLLTGCEVTEVFCRTARVRTVRTEDNFAAVLRLSGSDTVVTVNGCRATRGRFACRRRGPSASSSRRNPRASSPASSKCGARASAG